MVYAIIHEHIVNDVICLDADNAADFPDALALEDIPAGIGDTYDGSRFYRNGEPVLSEMEAMIAQMCDMADRLVDQEIQIATLELGGEINAL